jgi:hypothetical protein
MITTRLQSILDELRREGDCEIYIVMIISEGEVAALVVPHGSEGKPCGNPLDTRTGTTATTAKSEAGDWARLEAPMMAVIDESAPLLFARPALKALVPA